MARRDIRPGTPPQKLSQYYRASDLLAAHRANYFRGSQKLASSRQIPADYPEIPIGSWRYDDVSGPYGHEIDELVEISTRDLEPSEFEWDDPNRRLRCSGKWSDTLRYAEWIENGLAPPPISVVQTDRGTLRVIDGHRRLAAADLANVPVRAWVSWLAPNAVSGLTYEIATGKSPKKNPKPMNLREAMAFVSELSRLDFRAPKTGGLADGMAVRKFDTQTLAEGMLVEFEHSSDPLVAVRIAMDHLKEDRYYYRKLAAIEDPRDRRVAQRLTKGTWK